MNISSMFRYLDKKYYDNYANFLEFVKQYDFNENEINKLDEFGYNLLHYCSMKSNINSQCTAVLLNKKGDMYITSENEGLTPFEIALRKRNIDIMNIYIDNGYDVFSEDTLGFTLIDKLGIELKSNPEFYEQAIKLLEKEGLMIDKEIQIDDIKPNLNENTKIISNEIKVPSSSQLSLYLENADFKAASIHLRTEMENTFFERLLTRVGKGLEALINNRSLHDLIYDLFNLNIIDYDQKEYFIKAKNILNHFCHRGDSKNQLVQEFLLQNIQVQREFYKDLEKILLNI